MDLTAKRPNFTRRRKSSRLALKLLGFYFITFINDSNFLLEVLVQIYIFHFFVLNFWGEVTFFRVLLSEGHAGNMGLQLSSELVFIRSEWVHVCVCICVCTYVCACLCVWGSQIWLKLKHNDLISYRDHFKVTTLSRH